MTNLQSNFEHSDELEAEFEKIFAENEIIQAQLKQLINKFRKLRSSPQKPPVTIEQVERTAFLTFIGINELIAKHSTSPEAWQKAESIFHRAMQSGPSYIPRNGREDAVITTFQDIARFGYSLVVSDDFKAGDEFVDLWTWVKNYYRKFYVVEDLTFV